MLPEISHAQPAPAGSGTSDLRGVISDPSSALVPHVKVTLLRVLSGASRVTETAADGSFRFEDLAADSYTVIAEATGLSFDPKRFQLTAGQHLDVGTLKLALIADKQQVIVSASRVAELQAEAPTKVLYLSQEHIKNTGFENVSDVLSEVLSEVPGITTRAQSFGVGITGGEQIDGIDSKETLVLLDGLPLAGGRGINEGYIDLSQQDIGKLDHVEVVKGAASALYGTDAIGGVINLISRDVTQPFVLDATTSGGSLGQFDARLGMGGIYKNFSGYLDLEHHRIDSYTLIPNDISTVGADQDRQDMFAKLRYAFSPRAAIGFTTSGYINHDKGIGLTTLFDPDNPFNVSQFPTALRSNDSTQTYAVIGDFVPAEATTLQGRVYVSRYYENSSSRLIDENGVQGDPFDLGNLDENYRRADATVRHEWGTHQFIQAGYEWVLDQYRGDNRLVDGDAGHQVTTNDLWFQDRIQLFRKLIITAGGRYQNNSSYGSHFVPKVGAVYRINDHFSVRGAYGQGFRAPNLGELYYHLLHLEYGYQVIGNPTLRPETSQSFSAGGVYTQGRYQLSLNMFRNNLNNLIDNVLVCNQFAGQDCSGASLEGILAGYGVPPSFNYDTSGAAFFTFINLNVDKAYTQGFDVDGRIAVTPNITLNGAYTYLEAVDSTDSTWLPNRNRHQGYVKFEYQKPRWGFLANIRGNFFSQWPAQSSDGQGPASWAYGYQIWNLYASKGLGKGFRIYGAINNLADSRDQKLQEQPPSFDRPDYGRIFRIGLQYTFTHE